jgi:hypothetical protein
VTAKFMTNASSLIKQRRTRESSPADPKRVERAGTPVPKATTESDLVMQHRLLNEVSHEAVVVVEYVDEHLGIAEAREVDSGQPVSLTANKTKGLTPEHLRVGATLLAHITRFQHATAVETVPR